VERHDGDGRYAVVYAAELGELAGALVAWRHPERRGGGRAGGSNNGLAARCRCGRRIRVGPGRLRGGADQLRGMRRRLHRLAGVGRPRRVSGEGGAPAR